MNPICRSSLSRLYHHRLHSPLRRQSSPLETTPRFNFSKRWHFGHHTGSDHQHQRPGGAEEGERIFRLGLTADIGLSVGKALTGYLCGSTAIIADAAHSVSDVVCLSLIEIDALWWCDIILYKSSFVSGPKRCCSILLQSCQCSQRQRTSIWLVASSPYQLLTFLYHYYCFYGVSFAQVMVNLKLWEPLESLPCFWLLAVALPGMPLTSYLYVPTNFLHVWYTTTYYLCCFCWDFFFSRLFAERTVRSPWGESYSWWISSRNWYDSPHSRFDCYYCFHFHQRRVGLLYFHLSVSLVLQSISTNSLILTCFSGFTGSRNEQERNKGVGWWWQMLGITVQMLFLL